MPIGCHRALRLAFFRLPMCRQIGLIIRSRNIAYLETLKGAQATDSRPVINKQHQCLGHALYLNSIIEKINIRLKQNSDKNTNKYFIVV